MSDEQQTESGAETFISHLIELRNRLMKASAAVIVVFLCLMPWAGRIYDMLAHPMMLALPEGSKMIATGVITPFLIPVKVTLLVAFLPTYRQAGWVAPFLLCLLRFGQGFGLGGEWGGAALLAVENAPPGFRARFGMFPQLGAPVGFIAANGLFLLLGALLTPEQFQAWGWRLPFVGSILLVGVGLWIRLKLTETAAFQAAAHEAPPPHVPVAQLFRTHARETIGGTFARIHE